MSAAARIGDLYERLLAALALVACVLLAALMLMICADVFLRNLPVAAGVRGLPWANEVSESTLYLITMLSAPWLLHRGQHIRIDIVLRAIPKRIAWYCEWAVDALTLACCTAMVIYGGAAALASYRSGALTIKTLITPEWWMLAVLPIAFAMLGVEVVFRMQRLAHGERAPRDDAVSAS
jgi:TRAP-type C4-dicarboxylate transport system permease small subunit